jgi:hypothetical protein
VADDELPPPVRPASANTPPGDGEAVEAEPPKPKRGRPKGSKNTRTRTRTRGSSGAKSKPERKSTMSDGKLTDELSKVLTFPAGALAISGDLVCAQAMTDQAPTLAAETVELAKSYPDLRYWLEWMAKPGMFGGFALALAKFLAVPAAHHGLVPPMLLNLLFGRAYIEQLAQRERGPVAAPAAAPDPMDAPQRVFYGGPSGAPEPVPIPQPAQHFPQQPRQPVQTVPAPGPAPIPVSQPAVAHPQIPGTAGPFAGMGDGVQAPAPATSPVGAGVPAQLDIATANGLPQEGLGILPAPPA